MGIAHNIGLDVIKQEIIEEKPNLLNSELRINYLTDKASLFIRNYHGLPFQYNEEDEAFAIQYINNVLFSVNYSRGDNFDFGSLSSIIDTMDISESVRGYWETITGLIYSDKIYMPTFETEINMLNDSVLVNLQENNAALLSAFSIAKNSRDYWFVGSARVSWYEIIYNISIEELEIDTSLISEDDYIQSVSSFLECANLPDLAHADAATGFIVGMYSGPIIGAEAGLIASSGYIVGCAARAIVEEILSLF